MDRDNKKRPRDSQMKEERRGPEWEDQSNKKGKNKKKKNEAASFDALLDDADIFNIPPPDTATAPPSQHHRPVGVFDFPWQKDYGGDRLAVESDGCDLLNIFFSSLVDGSSAAIGFPGDRLSPGPAPISIPDSSSPSDQDEIDGLDCIWSSVLREPLSAVYCKGSIA